MRPQGLCCRRWFGCGAGRVSPGLHSLWRQWVEFSAKVRSSCEDGQLVSRRALDRDGLLEASLNLPNQVFWGFCIWSKALCPGSAGVEHIPGRFLLFVAPGSGIMVPKAIDGDIPQG